MSFNGYNGRNLILYYRLLGMIKPYWCYLFWAMLLMVLVAASSSAIAYIVKPVMDGVFLAKDYTTLAIIPLVVISLYAIKGVCSYCQSYLMQLVGQRIISEFRIYFYIHIQRLSLSYYDYIPTGELTSRIINDINLMQAAVSSVVTGILKEAFTILGLVITIFIRDWFLAIFAIGVFPFSIIPLVRFGRRLRRISSYSQEAVAEINIFLHETITGASIVKGFCREDYEIKRFSDEVFRLFQLTMKSFSARSISSPIMEFLGGLGIAIIIFYGGWKVIEGYSTPGTFFSFLAALIMLYEPVKHMSNLNSQVQSGLAAANRVYEIIDMPPQIVDHPNAIEMQTFKYGIEFKKVYFSYKLGKLILTNINLWVPAGQILALVGISGGGKTTLVNLLPRFYEVQEGGIYIDGVDIRHVSLKSLRSQIAVVTQQTILFNDTVRANIGYGRPEATNDQIIKAAKAAYALEFIEKLPFGFDTKIGEAGGLLSGGERQRISIARALLADRPILILDEATSSLDSESEMYVQKALDNLMEGRTTFVITHRLSTIKRVDRIIVLSNKHIVEDGKHEDLLKLSGIYRRLYNLQFAIT